MVIAKVLLSVAIAHALILLGRLFTLALFISIFTSFNFTIVDICLDIAL